MHIRDHYTTHNYFVFDGKSSLDFGVGISGSGTFRKSHRRLERFTIPGVNKTLTISDDTFEDIEIVYPAYFVEGFKARMDALAEWLLSVRGPKRLEDTYHNDSFRIGEFIGDIDPEMGTLNHSGRFDLVFKCDGRRFLKSGERVYVYTPDDIDKSPLIHPQYGRRMVVVNPTMFPAKPILVAPGLGTFRFNDTSITFGGGDFEWPEERGADPYHIAETEIGRYGIAFDCDNFEGYFSDNTNVSLNDRITIDGEAPVLLPGENYLIFNLGTLQKTSSFAVIPRWYKV